MVRHTYFLVKKMNWLQNIFKKPIIPESWKKQSKFLNFHDALVEYYNHTLVFLYPGSKWNSEEECVFMDSFAAWSVPEYNIFIVVGKQLNMKEKNKNLCYYYFEDIPDTTEKCYEFITKNIHKNNN